MKLFFITLMFCFFSSGSWADCDSTGCTAADKDGCKEAGPQPNLLERALQALGISYYKFTPGAMGGTFGISLSAHNLGSFKATQSWIGFGDYENGIQKAGLAGKKTVSLGLPWKKYIFIR